MILIIPNTKVMAPIIYPIAEIDISGQIINTTPTATNSMQKTIYSHFVLFSSFIKSLRVSSQFAVYHQNTAK